MIPLPTENSSVDFARDMLQPLIRPVVLRLSAGKSSRSSSYSFIIDIVEILKQYPLTRDLVHDKILSFAIQPRAPLPLCGC